MSTYEIGAFTEAELLAQGTAGSNIGYGDTFVMPASTSVTMDIWDNDSYLSGDNRHNENANDHTGQTATITENGSVISSGEQIYAECYHWVKDQAGNWYIMIEIEVENESGDYFSFYGDVPPEGSVLTVSCSRNVKCNWINYCNLQDPDNVSPPLAMDDALEISESETGGLNVLANDMDLDGTAITVTAVEGGTVGSSFVVETPEGYDALVTLNADGSLTVVPGPEFEAMQVGETTTVTFTYTITDADGLTDTATVTVTVNGETTLEAADDAILVWESEAAGDADGNVLDNDTMDGAQYDGEVTAINGSAANVGNWIDGSNGGKIQINADGSYDFDADGDFESLNDGDTAQTTFSYQISSSGEVTAAQKQNIMFVIDVSGSTAPATFAGGSVGDLNGDGMSNTILDAQIASYMALSAELASMNIDPNMVDIGLVAFNGSGVGTSGSITGDAQLLGTFKPGDNSLTNALQGLTDGGSTNFEAALYDTVDWFGDVNATTGDNNVVFFLSDGLNNTGNSFANEVSALENNYDASLIAVGVGNNADLGELNQIDNTGGAEIVTTTDALTASLIEGLTEVVDITDTATLTVTVQGEDDFTIEAIDDAITVMEDEGAGDADGNVLTNDLENDQPYSGAVVGVNGVNSDVGTWIDGTNGGRVKINADGSYDFDADGDFDGLNDGDSAQTTFNYQISVEGEVTTAQKQNIMFVIDVSGSTAPATFAGGSVGDLNGDGMSNTILDAQIASYVALSAELAAMNIDPNMVDIGLVAFNGSGVGTSGSITGDAQLLGTFKPGDNSLNSALQGLTDGGSTNFESALYDANDWFGDMNATTGDNNVVFFLSDGLNNTGNSFADEVASLESTYDASLIAVGVGNNADLGQLNQIDNTGGAEIVTTTDALTTSLIDGLTQVVDISDTATLTVTVLGENDFTIDAIDDAITVMEDETAGDNDGNALDNDLEDAGSYTGDVTEVAGDAANVGQWVAGSNGGLIKVNADGTFDFDANGEFDALDNGETAQTTFTYQIATGGGVTETETTVDFNAYGAGVVVTNQIAGVTVSSSDPNKPPMIFDTSNPTGGDTDLASTTAGNVLIISEDGDSSDPDDNAGVGSLYFDFDNPARLTSLTFLDTEESGYLRFYDDTGALIETLMIPTVADGGISTLDFDVAGVSRLEVNLCGSGAIDDLVFTTETTEPPIMDTATITVTVEGQTDYVAIADTMTVLASEAAGDQDLLDNGDDSVLDNDIEDGGAYAGNVLEVNSDANNVGQTVVGTNGGLLVINADGTMDFDANGEFDGLIDGASAQTQFTYTIEDGKTASVTVTILGETVRIAVDDVMTVMESESFGDADLLDSGEDSVLDNDTENGGAYTDVVGAVNGSLGNVNSFVTGSNGGLLKINADGTVDFDANGEFDGLADGATAQTTFTYELISGEEATVTVNVVGEANTVAVDDVITVMESETSGDLETLDSGASTVLANDTTDGAAYGGLVEAVNGTAGDVGTAVVGSNGGLATIYSDGTIDFDANDEFDFLDAGQTASTTFTYDIAGGEQATVTVNVEGEDDPTGGGQVINLALMLNSVATMFEDASTAIYGLPDYQDWDGNGVDNQVMDMAYLMLEDFMSDAFTVAANAGVTLNVSLISFGDTTGGEGSQFTSIYNAANFDAKLDAKIAADDSGDYGTGFDNANAWFDSVATAGDTNAVFFLGNGLYTDAWNAEFTAMVTDHNVAVDAYLPDAVFSGTALDDLGFIDKDGVAEAIYMDDVALAGTYGVTPGQEALSLDHLIL